MMEIFFVVSNFVSPCFVCFGCLVIMWMFASRFLWILGRVRERERERDDRNHTRVRNSRRRRRRGCYLFLEKN
jgi:hypothetical protein